jgi:hypothetical protein
LKEHIVSEMSQAQAPDTTTGGTDPISNPSGVPEVSEDLDRADRTQSGSSQPESSGGAAGQPSDEDGLLNADLGAGREGPSDGGLSGSENPDAPSDPMPDMGGTGS